MNIMLKESEKFPEELEALPFRFPKAKFEILNRCVKKVHSWGAIFQFTVVVPTIISIIYFGFIASDVYVSESRFVVRSPDKPASAGLGLLLKTAGFSNSGDSAAVVSEYVRSRDALSSVNSDGLVRSAYTRGFISIVDRFNPLGWNGSFEKLYKYYREKVEVSQETSAMITTLSIKAFRPNDALVINQRLLAKAETIVNQLNNRGRRDLLEFAQSEVEVAKDQASRSSIALAKFRKRSGVVDPQEQAQVQIQMASKLQDELIATRSQLFQLKAFAPGNAQIPVLEAKAESLRSEISTELSKLTGGGNSLAGSAVQYQRLELEDQFAQKRLAAALTALAEAQNEAQRQQAYIETIVKPSLPDAPVEPRRIRGILTTLVLGFVAWAIASMLIAGVREHKD